MVGKDRKFPVGGFNSSGYTLSLSHTLTNTQEVFSERKDGKKIKWLFMLQPGNPLCVLLDWKEPLICVKCENHTAAVCLIMTQHYTAFVQRGDNCCCMVANSAEDVKAPA